MEYIDKLRHFLVLILAFLLPYSAMLGATSAQPYASDGVSLKDTFYIRSAGNNQYLSASGSGVHLRPLNKSSDAFLWALDPVTYTYPCYVGMTRCDRRTKNETLSHFGGRFYKIVNLKSGQFLGRSGGGFYIGTTVDGRHLFWEVKKDPRQPNGNAHILRVANKPLNKTQWPLPATKFYQLTQRGRGVVATANAISAATGKQIETAPPANQVWHMEPGPKRDLVKLTIHSVKAIQTSTGRDGATDVLMRGVEIAIEYGPSFATGGGAAAVANGAKAAAAAAKAAALAAKQGFKSGGKKIGKQLATHGVKGTFKGIGKGIGKKFAEKTLTQLLKEGASKTAQKEIKKAARKALKEKIKKAALQQVAKLKAKVVKKMKMLRTYAKDPKKALTMKNLGKTGKRAHSQLTKHLKKKRLQEMADTANARSKKFAGIGVENIKKQNAVNAAKAGAAISASGPDQAIGKLDYDIFSSLEPTEHEFGLAREAYAALEYTESAEVKNSIKMCESWEAYIPPQSPIFVMSESGLTKFSKQAKELHEALVAAGAGPAAKSMNEIYVDAFAMPSGWLERGLAPFIDNTPDQLEIKIHGNSLWPNGGGDWRDIKKGETKNVGVEVVMDRTKGVNIQLIEYDSGSNDDNLGRLQFKTAGMRRAETFKHAFVHHSGEGSLYGINFTIAPFNNGSTKQDAAESRAMVACKNVKKAYDAVEWKFTKLEWYVNARKKIFDKYGLEGIAVYENSMDWMDAKACPAKNENYRKLLAGEWRVGRYDNSTAEKDRSATWTYTFTADGKVVTPTSTGEWRTRSYIDVDRFGSARDASDDRNTSPRSCELYLAFHDEKGRLGGGDFYGRGLTEELFPIRTEDSGLTIYKYDKKSTSNAILNMARKAFYNTDFGEYPNKKSAVPKARAGLDLWMEKIAGPQDKSQETAEKIQTNADAIIGIWDPVVGRNNPAGYGNTWTFASDNLFVSTIFNKKSLGGSYNTVDEMNAALYYRRSITGRWENLTDNRIKVTLDKDNRFRDFGFNNLKNDFIVDLVYTISPGSQPDLFIQYPAGDKLVEANKRQTIVKYIGLSDQSIEALEKIRIARGMPVPEVEREDYERFYAKRKQNWTAELVGLEEERQREIKSAVYWANQKVGEKALAVKAAFHSHGKCGASGQERKGNFIGEWAVGLHNRLGNKVTLPAGDANWTFEADGTLRGKMGGKDWSAKWSEVNGCKATATLDAAIAAHFKLEPKVTFDLAFVENGDRILSISETEKAITISYGNFNSGFADYPGPILAASGAQKSTDENRARYVLKYDQLVITRAGAANRCSTTWTNALVRPGMGPKGTPQVGFDISSVIAGSYSQWQTIGIYKVNFGGPEAIPLGEVNFHGANTIDINGPVRHNYSGIAGDEFVILNKLNECVNVSETSDIITPVRKVSRYRNKQFTKKYGPILLVETNVYNNKNFSTKELERGCSNYQWNASGEYLWADVKQKIGNSGPLPIHLYLLDKDGQYPDKKPVLTVKPGEFEVLDAKVGQKYTILDDANQCVGVTGVNRRQKLSPQSTFGDGSTPIVNDDYLTDSQIANGCYNYGKVRSGENRGLEDGRGISNSGSENLYVHWVDVWGEIDKKYPNLTLKPGESRNLVDYTDAKYTVLDERQQCVAVFGMNGHGLVLGDGSTPTKSVASLPQPKTPQKPYAPTQIANGCQQYGKLVSKPHWNTRTPTVHNIGKTPLTVNWISFYGAEEDNDNARNAGPTRVLKAGERVKLDAVTGYYYSVLDSQGQCIGIVDAADLSNKAYFPYQDAKSETDEKRRKDDQKRRDDAMNDKIAKLNEGWSESTCVERRQGWYNISGKMKGLWHVDHYDGLGLEKLSIWTIDENDAVVGVRSDGSRFEANIRGAADCKFTLAGFDINNAEERGTYKYIQGKNGVETFFRDKSYNSTVDRDGNTLKKPRPVTILQIVAHKVPNIGPVADSDSNVDAVDEDAHLGDNVGITAWANSANPDGYATYTLNNDAGGLFTIDPKTGVVSVAGMLDYEQAASHTIEVLATDTTKTTNKLKFEIAVNDVNEASISQIVDMDSLESSFWENIKIGERARITAQASDADGSDDVSYSLSDDAGGLFEIDRSSGVVTIAGELDREETEFYAIEVTARSSDGSSTREIFEIHIKDDIREYSISDISDTDHSADSVDEGSQIGDLVGVTAFARDGDYSDSVTYKIYRPEYSYFDIDPNTGVLSVSREIDFETTSSMVTVDVVATSSDGTRSSHAFEITIRDVNENNVSAVKDLDERKDTVTENARIGSRTGIVAWAMDKDRSDTVSYSLSDDAGGLFTIDSDGGRVTVAGQIDREDGAVQSIEIAANSTDGSSSYLRIDIAIKDQNEFAIGDISDDDQRSDSIDENVASGAEVGVTVFANDDDGSDTVTYSISNYEAQFLFDIDSRSGVITTRGDFDREKEASHTIEIIATSSDRSTSWSSFEIAVNDVNEADVGNPSGSGSYLTVDENAPIGTLFGLTIHAEDYDSTDTVTYSLIDDAGGLFAIDAHTGEVSVAGALDREAPDVEWGYNIEFTAHSSDGSTSQYSQSATIRINDVNEYSISDIADLDNAYEEVSEDAARGTAIGLTVSATDGDATDSRVTYSLMDANGESIYNGPFAIDDESGVITINDSEKLDYETNPNPVVNVKAWSADGSTSQQSFTVNLIDVYEPEDDVQPENPTVNIVRWNDNPQDQRSNDPYRDVSDAQWNLCQDADYDENSPDFNNETAFYDCLDQHLTTTKAVGLADNPELTCARQYGLEPETSVKRGKVKITNNHGSPIEIRMLRLSGNIRTVANIQPGETAEIKTKLEGFPEDPRRRVVFVGFDSNGICIGAGKPMESRNSFTFGSGNSQTADNSNDGGDSSGQFADDLLTNRCGERGQIVSNYIEQEANVTIRNTGSSALYVYWVDYSGNEVNYQGENLPEATALGGQDVTIDAWRGSVFVVTDEAGKCVGIAQARESRNDYSYGDNSFNPVKEQSGGDTSRSNNETTDQQSANGCSNRGRIASNYEAFPRTVSIANTGSDDLYVYWVNYDGDEVNYQGGREPERTVAPGQRVEIDAWQYFAFVIVDRANQCVGIAHANSPEGDSYSYGDGSYPVNSNSGTVANPDSANDNNAGEQKQPGWDRDVVFFEPAYNYCTGERGFVRGSQEYADCYYAY